MRYAEGRRSMVLKLVWNKELKIFGVIIAFLSLLTLLVCNLILAGYRVNQNREYNQALASMVGNVMETYPDAPMDSLIIMLNDRENVEIGERFLAQYGIFIMDEDSVFSDQIHRISYLQWIVNLIFIELAAVLSGVFFLYLSRHQARIYQICDYMEELVRGNYGLDISDNGDDELSSLKNEVYKLTVFFREQAKRASDNRRALADSVADISHQLKTPLTSVRVLVDNLSENEDMDADTRHRFLTEISTQISGVTWLVATILKLSRLDAGVVEMEKKTLKLRGLVEEVNRKLELNAEWRQVELCTDISDGILVKGDGQWLTEAFVNVVKNAIEHSNPEERVILHAEENDVYVLLTVQNRGQVIPEEEQKHLFERFYRGRSAGRDSVGIGLALANEIVKQHNGYITVESGMEQGTIFSIKFLKCH